MWVKVGFTESSRGFLSSGEHNLGLHSGSDVTNSHPGQYLSGPLSSTLEGRIHWVIGGQVLGRGGGKLM